MRTANTQISLRIEAVWAFLFFEIYYIFQQAMTVLTRLPLRKQAYSNILKILPSKMKFSDENSDISHISAQNIDYGYSLEPPRRGGSNEYPQFIFLSRYKKKMYTPGNPSFII